MSTDPIPHIPLIFGKLLNKLRVTRGIDAAEFATAARLTSPEKLASLENGCTSIRTCSAIGGRISQG